MQDFTIKVNVEDVSGKISLASRIALIYGKYSGDMSITSSGRLLVSINKKQYSMDLHEIADLIHNHTKEA